LADRLAAYAAEAELRSGRAEEAERVLAEPGE
jgi:hypothetical protein